MVAKIPTYKWMSFIPKNYLIKNLTIIGSHDSAAFTLDHRLAIQGRFSILNQLANVTMIGSILKKCIRVITITQDVTIKEQLASGVRFLDLRVAFNEKYGRFYLAHSFACIFLEEVLEDIRQFMENNPSEVVIIHIKPDYENRKSLENKLPQLFELISCRLYQYLWRSDGREYIGNKTLAEAQGKIVFCCDFADNNKALIYWRNTSYRENNTLHSAVDVDGLTGQLNSHWENTQDPEELFNSTRKQKRLNNNNHAGKLLQLDGAATPRTIGYILKMLAASFLTGIMNLFRNKQNNYFPVFGIAHNAEVIATSALKSDLLTTGSGCILTVDMVGKSLSSQALIQKAIHHSVNQEHIEKVDAKFPKNTTLFRKPAGVKIPAKMKEKGAPQKLIYK